MAKGASEVYMMFFLFDTVFDTRIQGGRFNDHFHILKRLHARFFCDNIDMRSDSCIQGTNFENTINR